MNPIYPFREYNTGILPFSRRVVKVGPNVPDTPNRLLMAQNPIFINSLGALPSTTPPFRPKIHLTIGHFEPPVEKIVLARDTASSGICTIQTLSVSSFLKKTTACTSAPRRITVLSKTCQLLFYGSRQRANGKPLNNNREGDHDVGYRQQHVPLRASRQGQSHRN